MSEPEDDIPPEGAPAKGGSKIMPIILVVNTLMITGVLIFVMKRPSAQAAPAGKEHGAAAAEHGDKSEHGDKADKHEKSGHGDHVDKEGSSEGHGEGDVDSDGPGPILKLESFIVQIRAIEGDRYAHLTLEMELGTEADKKPFESRMPRIRDLVIGYMSDRTEDELRGSEGLGQVKEALLKKLDETVSGHRVRALFITEFIIQ
jgi:flagellar protein FliL